MKDVADHLANFARASGRRLLELRSQPIRANLKEPGALVTQADQASHEILVPLLEKRFPGVPRVMEEQPNPETLPETFVVADELDGTALYARGLDDWAVTLAYIEKGNPVAGVLYQPARDCVVTAWRGGGTWLNGGRIRLEDALPLSHQIALFELNRQVEDSDMQWARRIQSATLVSRSLACAVASTIELLRGQAAVYLNCRGGKVWDFAAGALAVREAGGTTMSCHGEALRWDRTNMGVLFAASERIKDEVLALRI